ncbi:MAG: hypothetical protein IJR28_02255, partial [Ottowia sp.]|nr:hypothetical protein [Ottowia sp.]
MEQLLRADLKERPEQCEKPAQCAWAGKRQRQKSAASEGVGEKPQHAARTAIGAAGGRAPKPQ